MLESIWLFTGCRSFRGARDSELIKMGESLASLEMDFKTLEREQEARLIIDSGRNASLNGVPLSSAVKLMGEFLAMVFSPSHLSLVKDGPAARRRFIDAAICQISKNYARALSEYNRILLQRNSLLKDIPRHSELLDTLEMWDEKLALTAAVIYESRIKYTAKLKGIAAEIYSGLSSSKEEMEIFYERRVPEGVPPDMDFLSILKHSRKEDIISGATHYGIHRDDIGIYINDLSARVFGSQGQQRSGAIALKLSEAKIVKEVTGEQPIALLDDVMSELDISRQDYILNHIKGWQVFIACCDPSARLRLCEGKSFEVVSGNINKII